MSREKQIKRELKHSKKILYERGNCFRCGRFYKQEFKINTSQGMYCSKACALLSLIEFIKLLEKELYTLIRSVK